MAPDQQHCRRTVSTGGRIISSHYGGEEVAQLCLSHLFKETNGKRATDAVRYLTAAGCGSPTSSSEPPWTRGSKLKFIPVDFFSTSSESCASKEKKKIEKQLKKKKKDTHTTREPLSAGVDENALETVDTKRQHLFKSFQL